jgi:hypothetical protein
MLRRITLTSALVCLGVLSTACQEEGYDCTASFYTAEGGDLLSTKDYSYDDADDADEAKTMCMEEAVADKPADANFWSCSCSSR